MDKTGREAFWNVAEKYMSLCEEKGVMDSDWAQNMLAKMIRNDPGTLRYRSVIVDECQDLRSPALRMLRAIAGEQRKNDMYLSGDTRQRIYGGSVTLSQCGIIINNRSRILKLNYRTTEEIYNFAMQLQNDYQYDDMDGKSMSKDKSTCIFHGPAPFIRKFETKEQEAQEMIREIRDKVINGVWLSDICIMVRSNSLLRSFKGLLEMNGLKVLTVDSNQPDEKDIPGVRIMTMHRGKGMEYDYVYLPCLCHGLIPSMIDLKKAEDEEMLQETIKSEANLLSVAITRAKRQVWLSYYGSPSDLIKRYIK